MAVQKHATFAIEGCDQRPVSLQLCQQLSSSFTDLLTDTKTGLQTP